MTRSVGGVRSSAGLAAKVIELSAIAFERTELALGYYEPGRNSSSKCALPAIRAPHKILILFYFSVAEDDLSCARAYAFKCGFRSRLTNCLEPGGACSPRFLRLAPPG